MFNKQQNNQIHMLRMNIQALLTACMANDIRKLWQIFDDSHGALVSHKANIGDKLLFLILMAVGANQAPPVALALDHTVLWYARSKTI